MNNGTCSGSDRCVCTPFFTGVFCEEEIMCKLAQYLHVIVLLHVILNLQFCMLKLLPY